VGRARRSRPIALLVDGRELTVEEGTTLRHHISEPIHAVDGRVAVPDAPGLGLAIDEEGLRKFRVRGLVKAGTELIWACLTYNVMQWLRLTKPAAAR